MEQGPILKKIDDGADYFKRRNISINSVVEADDGTFVFIGRSKLHGSVSDSKSKTNRLRGKHKHSHDE